MKRFPVVGILLLIPAVALLILVGCNTGGDKNKTTPPGDISQGAETDKTKKGKLEKITTDASAIVIGSVKIAGKAPEEETDPRIAEHKSDSKYCGSASGFNTKVQKWDVIDGKVANVVIFLAPPAGKEFAPSDKVKDSFKTPREIDQPYCQYVPHVVAIYSEIQPLIFKNGAQVQHNVKINPGALIGSPLDQTLSPPKKEDNNKLVYAISDPRTFKGNDKVIDATCSAHNWMNAKIAIFNHPYFAVTGDDGKFKIDNVPIDTPLTVYMWHESMGGMDKKQKVKTESFKKGENPPLDLEISAK